ncbi:MAG: OprD family outer membrane porin [Aestuariivirga sp.]|uniref:OprD family outer membrane porin n=1 Tax=Aestuariivirga sp. TaxID=2650926 RepID=UPI0038CF7F68
MSRICGGALCLLIAGTVTFAATGMTSAAGPAITKQDAIRAALFDDAALTLHLRSYLFDRSNNEGDDPAAWATGGWVGYQTGWIGDMLRFGAVAYTSQPLWAPEDRPGSLLLLPDQEGFSVLGQAYAALRYDGQLLTLGRQLVDQPEINPHDNRMAPITYEGASLGGDVGIFSYYAAFLTATKTRGSDKFENFAEAAGVDSNEPMYLGGLAFSPGGDIKTRTSLYAVPDILMSSYTDWQWSGQPDSYSFSLSGQVYCLKLELAAELPSLHWTPPVPLNTLTRCPRNRQQANGSLRLKRSERHLP